MLVAKVTVLQVVLLVLAVTVLA
jgi:hypothetical protein